jgi:hypothetical protein
MRVLEVRFRPQVAEPFLVVGHLVWLGSLDGEPALLRRAPTSEATGSSDAFVAKLEYLVSSMAPESFPGLLQLRSRFWSFVEVAPGALKTAGGGTQSSLVKSWLRVE